MRIIFLIFLFTQLLFARFIRKSEVVHVEGITTNQRWVENYKSYEQNISYLFEFLEKSEYGSALLKTARAKAKTYGLELHQVVKPGLGSITDTTLVRRFSETRPDQIEYDTKSVVYINQDLDTISAVLDLAHELTHFIQKNVFNPYSNDFTVDEFVRLTIEGRGGEVDAYIAECKVLYELFPDNVEARTKCDKIRKSDGTYSRRKGAQLFYQVGSYHKKMRDILGYFKVNGEALSMMSKEKPSFISSAYGEPYPYAALKEFVTVMKKACGNEQKRISLYRAKIARTPASVSFASDLNFTINEYKKLRKSHFLRCSDKALFKANDALR